MYFYAGSCKGSTYTQMVTVKGAITLKPPVIFHITQSWY